MKPKVLMALVAVALLPGVVAACGACVHAFAERALPPTNPWSLIGLGFFLSVLVFLQPLGTRRGFVNVLYHLAIAFGIIVATFVLVFWGAGPIPLLLMIPAGFYLLYRVIRDKRESLSRWKTRGAWFLGVVAALAMLVTAVPAFQAHARRDTADWIMRHPDSTFARGRMHRLAADGDWATLRHILIETTNGSLATTTAGYLAKSGDAETDGRLIIEAMRLPSWTNDKWIQEQFANALGKLLNVTPQSGMTPDDWEALLPPAQVEEEEGEERL